MSTTFTTMRSCDLCGENIPHVVDHYHVNRIEGVEPDRSKNVYIDGPDLCLTCGDGMGLTALLATVQEAIADRKAVKL